MARGSTEEIYLTSLAVDLDAVMQELLEGHRVQDLVLHGLPAVDGELGNVLLLRLLVSFLQNQQK